MSFTGKGPSVLLAEVHSSSRGEKSSSVLKQGKCRAVKHTSESWVTITQLHRQVLQPTVNSDYSAFARVYSSFEATIGTGVLPYPRKYAFFEFCSENDLQILNLFKKHFLSHF